LRAFAFRSSSRIASKLRKGLSAKTKQELSEGSRSWVLYGLGTYIVILLALLSWIRIHRLSELVVVLKSNQLLRDALQGVMLGLVLVGILFVLRRSFPVANKFGYLILAGISSPVWVRISALVLVAFIEEFWRVVCLTSLIANGLAGPDALLATSVVYGFTCLSWGNSIVVSNAFVGAAYGPLYLWSGSFLVPLMAQIILRGKNLLYFIAASPDADLGDIQRRPHGTCPAWNAALNLRQVNFNFNEAFLCPSCHTRITVSDRRRVLLRWGFVPLCVGLMFASGALFRGTSYDAVDRFWIVVGVSSLGGLGLMSFLQVIFPPKLECGDPDFIRLKPWE
jgi:hypothetical protein